MEVVNAVGRRKTAVARVYLNEGKGNITINKKSKEQYITFQTIQYNEKQHLELLRVLGQYDIKVNLVGGGFNGQAEALRLGIARALVKVNAEDKSKLRAAGFMTRDPREEERKKPGRPGARKRFQFSKR